MKTKFLIAGLAAVSVLAAGAAQASTNLVTNGDFEAGNTGFASDYAYIHGNGWPEAAYDVNSSPFTIHSLWANFGDHTTGQGLMMIVNGAGTANTMVWGEAGIGVQANTTYEFGTWIRSTYPTSPAELNFTINGSAIAPTFFASSDTSAWQFFSATWYSGASTTADIALWNQNLAAGGNDFALDDISFSATGGVPEPAAWAMMLLGFAGIGGALRSRPRTSASLAA